MFIKKIVCIAFICIFHASAEKLYSADCCVGGIESGNYFSYDMAIPTLIKYSSKVDGCISRTGSIGITTWGSGSSTSSIEVGYNATMLTYQPSLWRTYSIFLLGWVPFAWEVAFLDPSRENIALYSPLIGFNHSRLFLKNTGLALSINAGPVYGIDFDPYKTADEAYDNNVDISYESYVSFIDAMHDVPGHWGARLNCRIMPLVTNTARTIHFGPVFGYTQFIFPKNKFNTYEIGVHFAFLF